MKHVLAGLAMLVLLAACTSKEEDPQPQPQPGPNPSEIWLLEGYNSGDQPNTLQGYRERNVYHGDLTLRAITGDTLTSAPEDPAFSFRHEFIYEGGIFTKISEFDVYERTFHVAFELQYDAQKRIASIDQYLSSFTNGRVYTSTRKFFYNAAGKVDRIETWDTKKNVKFKDVRYTWTGNNVTRQDVTNYNNDGQVANTWNCIYTYYDAVDIVWKAVGKELLAADAYFDYVPHEHQIKKAINNYPDMLITDNYSYTTDARGLDVQKKHDRTYERQGQQQPTVTTYYTYAYRKATP